MTRFKNKPTLMGCCALRLPHPWNERRSHLMKDLESLELALPSCTAALGVGVFAVGDSLPDTSQPALARIEGNRDVDVEGSNHKVLV